MQTTRRDFLKTTGLACGAANLPSWVSEAEAAEAAATDKNQLVDIARANSLYQRKPVKMAPVPRIKANWKSAYEEDPFDVSIDDKIRFLLKLNETAMATKGVSFVNSAVSFQNEQKFYASTDGSRIEQYIVRSHPSFTVTAVNREIGRAHV